MLDQRPATAMRDLCAARGVQLLCYGTVAGGLLGERYLDAAPPAEPLENRSLVKYRLIVDEIGGWAELQRRLRALATVAQRHRCGIAEVATAWVLQQPQVGAAIVGARHAGHLAAAARAATLALDPADNEAIVAAWPPRSPYPATSTRWSASPADVTPRRCATSSTAAAARG